VNRVILFLFGSLVWLAVQCQHNNPPACSDANGKCPPCHCGTGGAAATGGTAATGGKSSPSSTVAKVPVCKQGFAEHPYTTEQISKWAATLRAPYLPKMHPPRLLDVVPTTAIGTVMFQSNRPKPLTQTVGSCTCEAAANVVSTQPFKLSLLQSTADQLYRYATTIDPFPGSYPPNDTGSDGASACKALVHYGYAVGCLPTFWTLAEAETQLQSRPIMWGVNWYDSMFTPDNCGHLSVSGVVKGGHETALEGIEIVRTATGSIDPDLSYLIGENSWGQDWGVCIDQHCGFYRISLRNANRLITEGAEFDGPVLP
jgi:hypothetical protein